MGSADVRKYAKNFVAILCEKDLEDLSDFTAEDDLYHLISIAFPDWVEVNMPVQTTPKPGTPQGGPKSSMRDSSWNMGSSWNSRLSGQPRDSSRPIIVAKRSS